VVLDTILLCKRKQQVNKRQDRLLSQSSALSVEKKDILPTTALSVEKKDILPTTAKPH
jgi:hypothetical protein